MRNDRRLLKSYDEPINYTPRMRRRWIISQSTRGFLDGPTTDHFLKAYVRYLDGSRSMDMPIGNAFDYLDMYGGRLCYKQATTVIQAAIDRLDGQAADALRHVAPNPHYEADVKPIIRPRIGSIYRQQGEAGSSIADRPPAVAGIEADAARQPAEPWEDDHAALAYLKRQGYRIDRDWNFIHPRDYKPTSKDFSAANYLFNEWDMGRIRMATCGECHIQTDEKCDICGAVGACN